MPAWAWGISSRPCCPVYRQLTVGDLERTAEWGLSQSPDAVCGLWFQPGLCTGLKLPTPACGWCEPWMAAVRADLVGSWQLPWETWIELSRAGGE